MQLVAGQKYIISSYAKTIDKAYRCNLLAMGLIPGAEFFVQRFAPLGQNVQIVINQASLSVRANEFLRYINVQTP